MDPIREQIELMTRRHFFGRTGLGPGDGRPGDACWPRTRRSETTPTGGRPRAPTPTGGLPGLPHFPPKAKRAIYLFMNGGPSQMDLFDYKPKMDAMFDKDLPDSIRKGQRLTTMTSGQARFPIAPSKYKFARHGKSGMWVSELLPWTAKIVDEIALIKTVWTEAINHDPAVTYICTGNQLPGPAQPGLMAQLRPGHDEPEPAGLRGDDRVVDRARRPPRRSTTGSGARASCPASTRAWPCARRGDPVLFLSNPAGVDAADAPAHARRPRPAQPAASSTRSPTPRPRPGSPSTRWRSGCRPRSPS